MPPATDTPPPYTVIDTLESSSRAADVTFIMPASQAHLSLPMFSDRSMFSDEVEEMFVGFPLSQRRSASRVSSSRVSTISSSSSFLRIEDFSFRINKAMLGGLPSKNPFTSVFNHNIARVLTASHVGSVPSPTPGKKGWSVMSILAVVITAFAVLALICYIED